MTGHPFLFMSSSFNKPCQRLPLTHLCNVSLTACAARYYAGEQFRLEKRTELIVDHIFTVLTLTESAPENSLMS